MNSVNKWASTWQNQQSECAPSEDSNQPGHAPSLIKVFAVRMKKAWVLSYPLRTGERGGSVVECRTPEREVRGSRPTSAVLCPWARHFTPRKYWLITQEAMAPSRHDWKIVDWDVKPQHNQPTIEGIAKTLIRLGECPGWSEFSLGAHSFCWFCHVAAQMWFIFLNTDLTRKTKRLTNRYNNSGMTI